MSAKRRAGLVPALLALALAALAACSDRDGNFSQYPGFAEWFRQHPPSTSLPDDADRALLARWRPRLYLPEDHEGPIRFYEDYIAHGKLIGIDGSVLSDHVTQDHLNALKHHPLIEFRHIANGAKPQPVMYGRVDREDVTFPGEARPRRFTFLTYHAVFRVSGLPLALRGWQEWLLDLIANPWDWHQLDHYTAVMLALDESLRPVAATFQHHNYMHTLLIGGGIDLPADGRLRIDVAIRSNELYPHKTGRTVRRAAGFLNADTAPWIVLGHNRPWRAGDDVTDPAREVDYTLRFLAPSDAFYTFEGYLGERRGPLPGRDGPPGADYNTLPRFKPRGLQMTAFYWQDGETGFLDAFEKGGKDRMAALSRRFFHDWQCLAPQPPAGLACTK